MNYSTARLGAMLDRVHAGRGHLACSTDLRLLGRTFGNAGPTLAYTVRGIDVFGCGVAMESRKTTSRMEETQQNDRGISPEEFSPAIPPSNSHSLLNAPSF